MQGEQFGRAFERRIKRYIVGPEHRFAVVVPGELTQICLREVNGLGIEGAELTDAGVEFTGKLTKAYLCNLWLRTASRVLCRLVPFRAGAAEELFHKTKEIPWELWINPGIPLRIEAHVEHSRISHEGRVAELISRGIERSIRDALGVNTTVEETSRDIPEVSGSADLRQRILVRLIGNHCGISLDMSGHHLHERGYRLHHAGAPLRETLAAAILLKMEWNGDTPLVDGMCGSGTFPIEAAMIAGRIPPGQGRSFLFERWPSFQAKTWQYLRGAATAAGGGTRVGVWGIDIQNEAIGISRENAMRSGVGDDIVWKEMDFFDFDPHREKLKNGLLVLNPPYGRRLEGGGRPFYDSLGNHLRRAYKGWKYAVLAASRTELSAMKMPLTRIWSFRHGGTPIYAVLGKV